MFDRVIETTGHAIEAAGALVIVLGLIFATVRFVRHPRGEDAYHSYRRGLGRSLLLGLELLVAADIIETVTTQFKLDTVLALAIVVAIRTFLSFSIQLEVEGRLPWRDAPSRARDTSAA